MSSIKELLKRYPLSEPRTLILLTNLIYIASILLKMYLFNPEYFFENAFQTVNLIFYLFVLLSYIFIRNVKLYFLSSVLLILDLPVNLKPSLQNFLAAHLNVGGIFGHPLAMHIVLLLLLGLFIFIVYRFRVMEYFQIFLFFFYAVSFFMIVFKTPRIHSTPLQMSDPVSSISKNYYFLLFDEYPNEEIIKKYNLSGKADYPSTILKPEGFVADQNIHSNFLSTVRSTTNFLTGSLQPAYNVNNTINAIYNNVFTRGSNYSFSAFSILDDQNRPNSLFSRYYFYNFNNLLTQKVIPILVSLLDKRGVGNYTNCEAYNADALTRLEMSAKAGLPHVTYIHFFTPHYYPAVIGQPASQRLQNANQWMLKAVHTLNQHDPKAGIIIFSDHGWRKPYIPLELWTRNMLYFRNVELDTVGVNKNGLVELVKSIKF